MVNLLTLWFSYAQRRDLRGIPSAIPDHLDAFLGELPLVRDAFDAPEARIRSGYWYPRGTAVGWRLRSPHPLTRVFVFGTKAWWCGERIRRGHYPLPLPLAVPFPAGQSTHYHEAYLPPAFEEHVAASTFSVGVFHWSPQPLEQVRRWLDAADEYLSRQREIMAGLADWAADAEQIDHRKPWHAGRIASGVPAQREAMSRLCKASDDYQRVYDEIRAAVTASPDPNPAAEPTTALLRWANRHLWLVVDEPEGEGMRIFRHDAVRSEVRSESWELPLVTYRDERHKLANQSQLLGTHLTGRGGGDSVPLVWDEASVALCDREIAELWEGLEDHDLPGDFDAFWRIYCGYDRRSAAARNRVGTKYKPEPHRRSARRRGYPGSGGGGGDIGYYGGVAVGGSDSGGSGCGGGGGGGCGGGD